MSWLKVGYDGLAEATVEYIAPNKRRSESQTERDLFDDAQWIEEEDVEPEAEALADAEDPDALLTAMAGGDWLERSSGNLTIEVAKLRPRSGWPRRVLTFRPIP